MAIFTHCLILLALAINISAFGLFPSRKAWWAKQITPDLYAAGRLTESQVKYASEAGFKSIIAIPIYSTAGAVGEEILPDDQQLAELATKCGLYYEKVMEPGWNWASMETLQKFTAILAKAPPPYLILCNNAVSSAFNAIGYLANQTKYDPSFKPQVNTERFFSIASSLGLNYNQARLNALVSNITGEDVMSHPPVPDVALTKWPFTYWQIKPLAKYVYVSGQLGSNYIEKFKAMGPKVFVNLRKGVTTPPNDEPSQEEVTLLNIKDRTGTYEGTGRQSKQRLLESRIDPNKPNDYVGPGSMVNYASRNYLEYGDEIGYNETLVKLDFQEKMADIKYIHTPIGGQYKYTTEMWAAYKDIWMDAVKSEQSVVFACRTGYRASVAALLTLGALEKRDSTWALEQARERGYYFEEGDADTVVKLFRDVLDKNYSTGSGIQLAPLSGYFSLTILGLVTAVLYL